MWNTQKETTDAKGLTELCYSEQSAYTYIKADIGI